MTLTQTYNADAIEVLTGLEPVRRRPGMYTDTRRPGMYTDTVRGCIPIPLALTIWGPNHLGQEVIDNSVDGELLITVSMKHWRATQNAWM